MFVILWPFSLTVFWCKFTKNSQFFYLRRLKNAFLSLTVWEIHLNGISGIWVTYKAHQFYIREFAHWWVNEAFICEVLQVNKTFFRSLFFMNSTTENLLSRFVWTSKIKPTFYFKLCACILHTSSKASQSHFKENRKASKALSLSVYSLVSCWTSSLHMSLEITVSILLFYLIWDGSLGSAKDKSLLVATCYNISFW